MRNRIVTVVSCMVLVVGCQQADEIDNMSEELPMSIEASIGDTPMSRYASSDNSPNNLSFAVGDEIGMFVHDRSIVKWTLKDNEWKPATSSHWPNKEDEFGFYAYYPYNEATSKESVKMPSLAGQTGTIESLSTRDFLVASTEESYGTDGVVSFTENASFKHVSSLVAITVKGDCDLKTSTINKISFAATNIASATTYSFSTEETSFVENEELNKLESGALNYTMTNEDKTFYFILNKGIALSDITFSIEYSTGEKNYKAEKANLGAGTLSSGSRYNFNVSVSDGVLMISGVNIQDWGNGTQMDDIEINSPTEVEGQDDEDA